MVIIYFFVGTLLKDRLYALTTLFKRLYNNIKHTTFAPFRDGHGKLSVFVVKMALATICGGKILDKLRCKRHG